MTIKWIVPLLAIAGLAGAQGPRGDAKPVAGRPACRIYPTSVTSTTVGAGIRTVVTFTSKFDPYWRRTTTDMTYSDSRGIRNSNRMVTDYESIADFVHEVVRSSGYRGSAIQGRTAFTAPAGMFERGDIGRGIYLSAGFGGSYRTVANVDSPMNPRALINGLTVTGAPATATTSFVDWSVNTIPPLKFYKQTVLTGATPMTHVNTFDSRNQLKSFTTTQPAPISAKNTVTYDAWDDFGRPTRGASDLPDSVLAIGIAYDDLARTMTTTTTSTHRASGQKFTTVMVETFDWNGNSVRTETKAGNTTSVTTNQFHEMAVTCTGPINPPLLKPLANPGAPDPGYTVRGTMTSSIDDPLYARTRWNSTSVQGSFQEVQVAEKKTVQILSVAGGDMNFLLSIGVNVTHGPGTYDVELPDPVKLIDPAIAFDLRGNASAQLFSIATKGGWQADVSRGKGTVTITSVSAKSAAGTFELTLEPTPGTGSSGTRRMSGSFNITF